MEQQYTTFRLGSALFGVNIFLVDEINRHLDLVPVAGAPPFVRGIANLRGKIVTVVDLAVKLGMPPLKITEETRCVVLRTSAELMVLREHGQFDDDTIADTVGILVDRIEDMVTINQSRIKSPPANVGDLDERFLAGVVQLENELMTTLCLREALTREAA